MRQVSAGVTEQRLLTWGRQTWSAVSQSWEALEIAGEPCLWLQKEAED